MSKTDLFAEKTLIDRGSMTYDEYWALFRYNMLTNFYADEYCRKQNIEHYLETKQKYDQSGFDFTGCETLSFGKRPVWFAVKTTNVMSLVQMISPSFHVEQSEWKNYDSEPSEGFSKRHKGNYLFLSQPCNGTIFIRMSGPIRRHLTADYFREHHQTIIDDLSKFIPNFWIEASMRFSDVFLCWEFDDALGVVNWNNGKLKRVIATRNYELHTFGQPIWGEETTMHANFTGRKAERLWGKEIMDTTYNLGIGTYFIPPLKPGEEAFGWFVGTEL